MEQRTQVAVKVVAKEAAPKTPTSTPEKKSPPVTSRETRTSEKRSQPTLQDFHPGHLTEDFLRSEVGEAKEMVRNGNGSSVSLAGENTLLLFARELSDAFQVPDYLKRYSTKMTGWISMRRNAKGVFHIQRYKGTPYGRAILYEKVREILKKPAYTAILERGLFERFNIRFTFDTIDPLLKRQPPEPVAVVGQTILLNRYKWGEPSGLWKYVMAANGEERADVGLNILAPIADVIDFFSEDNSNNIPLEVKLLRQSVAFPRSRFKN